jgi:hypothetical protein
MKSNSFEDDKDYFDKQIERDNDTKSRDIINIQKALDKAGVSDPVKREIIIKELCIEPTS